MNNCSLRFHAREKHYRCIVCFESVDGEVQRMSERATLCVCGPGESCREVCQNSTKYIDPVR